MSTERDDIEGALRDGLAAIPTPQPSADFQMRVLSDLEARTSTFANLLQQLRPVLAGAGLALPLMLAVTYLAGLSSLSERPARRAVLPVSQAAIDRALSSPDISEMSMMQLAFAARDQLRPHAVNRGEPPRQRRTDLPVRNPEIA